MRVFGIAMRASSGLFDGSAEQKGGGAHFYHSVIGQSGRVQRQRRPRKQYRSTLGGWSAPAATYLRDQGHWKTR